MSPATFIDGLELSRNMGGTPFGVPIIRMIVVWGSSLGSPCFGKLPYLSDLHSSSNGDPGLSSKP